MTAQRIGSSCLSNRRQLCGLPRDRNYATRRRFTCCGARRGDAAVLLAGQVCSVGCVPERVEYACAVRCLSRLTTDPGKNDGENMKLIRGPDDASQVFCRRGKEYDSK